MNEQMPELGGISPAATPSNAPQKETRRKMMTPKAKDAQPPHNGGEELKYPEVVVNERRTKKG